MNKFTYNEVKDTVHNLGYILLSKDYINNREKLLLMDEYGYFYQISLSNLKNNRVPLKFDVYNSYTIQNIKLWCKINNKPYELISDTYSGNNQKLKWVCLKDHCGEIFELSWGCVLQGIGCGVCNGRQVGLSNCLATKRPELAKEWHPTKNGGLTPFDVTYCSNKKVWWICSNNSFHEWKSSVNNRNRGNGCPYCSGLYPTNDNNLLINNPKLCIEWNYARMIKIQKIIHQIVVKKSGGNVMIVNMSGMQQLKTEIGITNVVQYAQNLKAKRKLKNI